MPHFTKALPWPGDRRMSGNLFEDRNWLLSPSYLNNNSKNTTGIISPKPSIKEEPKIGEQSIISPKGEKCGWGPNCPFYKNQDKEDWDGKHQNQLQQKTSPSQKCKGPKARCTQTLFYQKPKTHRSLTERHKLTGIWVRQNSSKNGRQKWKDWTLNTI